MPPLVPLAAAFSKPGELTCSETREPALLSPHATSALAAETHKWAEITRI